MALLFRLNVITKRLTSLYHSFNQPFLPQLHFPQRNLFTNSCNVYFAKKKDDGVKIPKCPDFEQYFTKPKRKEVVANETGGVKNDEIKSDKKFDDKRKPLIQLPIFGDKTKPPPQQRPIPEKKGSPVALPPKQKSDSNFPMKVPNIKEEKKASTDKVDSQQKAQTFDKKYSVTKSLNDFTQFSLMPQSLTPKNMPIGIPPPENIVTSVSRDDSKLNEKRKVVYAPTTEGHNSKIIRNYIWLAAAAFGAVGLALLMKNSTSDHTSQMQLENQIVSVKTGNPEKEGALVSPKNENTKMLSPIEIPKKVPYLIIGGGTASWSAFKAIKDRVPNAKVLVVSNEMHPPYMRPELTQNWDIWFAEADVHQRADKIYLEPSDFYTDPMRLLNESHGGVSILTNHAAKYLNYCERKVVLTDGSEIEYEECLLATGSIPRNLVIFQTAPLKIRNKISFFRNLNDFQCIKDIVDKSESIAVIGGGYRATEISLALVGYLSDWIKKKLREYDLYVIPNTQVDSVQMEKSKLKLGLLNGKIVVVDHVIVALGSQPDFAFAQKSGLKLANGNCGIAVNENLEALPHLYVAGDAACLPGYCGKEIETSYDNALASGQLAGENMVGQKKSFNHRSMFFSNLGPKIYLASVGVIDSALKTVGVFSNGSNLTPKIDNTEKGVVFYMKNDIVVGVLLWNIKGMNRIDVARQVIAEKKRLYDLNEVVERFEIQE